ncbi:hypothetical protein Zmor_011427 [Zophobas morio]|uniref:Uncharacterized protein n=1 Tax=Zophobas morio TaxID=2755281 RepID=A0AA38MKU0_9CUCU|nr:hypothetical protein Zmor_011427 [Zophobas morio]
MLFKQVQSVFIILVISTYIPPLVSRCHSSYITTCDTFEDIKNKNLKELIVGSTQLSYYKNKMTTVRLDDVITTKMKILMIIRRIKHLEKCKLKKYSSIHMDLLILYGNVIPKIQISQFPIMSVKKFSLVHNKIQEIEVGALRNHRIIDLDLSENQLSRIKNGALPVSKFMRIITIKSNELELIEPGSLHPHLRVLNLDQNKLKHLNNVLDNLLKLEELTLSHNKFSTLPNLTNLKYLKIVDVSFNELVSIKYDSFKHMNLLQVVNLESNKICNSEVLQHLPVSTRRRPLIFSLAMNRLKQVNLEQCRLKYVIFIRYGNLWDCEKARVIPLNLTLQESRCSLEYYSSGQVPYCIDYSSFNLSSNTSQWEKIIKKFHDSIRENSEKIGCDLVY